MTAHLSLQEAADFLRQGDDYLILSHRRPDGDTVGSCVGLCRALRAMGKQAWIYPNPQFTPRFAPYLEGLIAEGQGQRADAGTFTVLSCDIASPALFPFGMEEARVELAVDHHGTNNGFAVRTLVDPNAAACGELLTALPPRSCPRRRTTTATWPRPSMWRFLRIRAASVIPTSPPPPSGLLPAAWRPEHESTQSTGPFLR